MGQKKAKGGQPKWTKAAHVRTLLSKVDPKTLWCRVRWELGRDEAYRCGDKGKYDLAYGEYRRRPPKSAEPPEPERTPSFIDWSFCSA